MPATVYILLALILKATILSKRLYLNTYIKNTNNQIIAFYKETIFSPFSSQNYLSESTKTVRQDTLHHPQHFHSLV